ncbi:Zinc finger domain-containing protein [Giardia muris]|uniref:Zinc finger domain-containing protein n=1 Tax=Giardia muris TaxID=5742 RepID=A0A4Z1T8L2_GIAMU|nr:Zinc finger domain-containing protein [Giardia muris]|eukprot:TNJ29467.1 Zinc finger domain-containing protein [Giardia muris]
MTEPCAVCQRPARYCCPRCATRTCSLACCNTHKVAVQCSGKWEPDYIPLIEFTQLDFEGDIQFLYEKAIRQPEGKPLNPNDVDSPFGLPTGHGTQRARYNAYCERISPYIPERRRKLLLACLERDTYLYLLPPHTPRAKDAAVTYYTKADKLEWALRITLVSDDTGLVCRSTLTHISEDVTLSYVLWLVLLRHWPTVYAKKKELPTLEVGLVDERAEANRSIVPLDPMQTLKEILRRRVILQCPVIYIFAPTLRFR